jgi:glutamate-1-semialdehyde 2,1-aminomutase
VLRFRGHFHGWHDHAAFAVTSHFDGTPTPGVLPALTSEVALADAGDNVAVARILAQGDVAAAIIEPTGASWGQVPVAPQFVQQLRELTARHGTLLIFDEVISGFRCAPGGAQQALNICPDLTTLAKILAGGLPGGAVAGRRDLLDQLDFAASAQANREKIPHQGTFNANPLSAAAGITTLGIVESTGACAQASDYAARLREELTRVLHDEQSCWVVYGSYSGFHLFTNPDRLPIGAADIESGKVDYRALKRADRTTNNLLRVGMMCHGVEIFGWPGGPTSTAHTNDDLEQTADALRQTIRTLEERA